MNEYEHLTISRLPLSHAFLDNRLLRLVLRSALDRRRSVGQIMLQVRLYSCERTRLHVNIAVQYLTELGYLTCEGASYRTDFKRVEDSVLRRVQ